jgi:hypothetical protein
VHQYLVLDGYDHRRICAAQLIRDGKRWYALTVGEADGIVTATPSDFATGPSVEGRQNRSVAAAGTPQAGHEMTVSIGFFQRTLASWRVSRRARTVLLRWRT